MGMEVTSTADKPEEIATQTRNPVIQDILSASWNRETPWSSTLIPRILLSAAASRGSGGLVFNQNITESLCI